jgi:iron uptake system component EfeO
MTVSPLSIRATLILGMLPLIALAGCGGGDDAPGPASLVSVDSGADTCVVSATQVPAGNLTFRVTNSGTEVTEFYLLDDDGLGVVGEVENIAPGLSRELVVAAREGEYVTACKPGMRGAGIRDAFRVTPSEQEVTVAAADAELIAQANRRYKSYVTDQSAQLVEKTAAFARLYAAGDDDAARRLYPRARVHWERIETVAESFGDLDPRLDAREADLEPGQEWTGWHRIEKDLWPRRAAGYTPLTPAERRRLAGRLLADTRTLDTREQDLEFTADQIANGSRGLLEEVATGKITGEEEYWSRTDLWDFQANVDGARVAFDGVREIVDGKDPALGTEIEERFDELQALLDAQRVGDGFRGYDELSPAQIRQFSDAVNALAEPLSRLTAVVVS